MTFLNQARAGRRLACALFLIIASVRECLYVYVCVYVCVCVRPRGYEKLVAWYRPHMIG